MRISASLRPARARSQAWRAGSARSSSTGWCARSSSWSLIRPPHVQAEYWTLAIFAAQDFLFTGLTGLTLGKLVLRIRVVRLDGGMIGLGWALVRTLLLLCVIPPLITDRDLRGLHDRAANAAVVRL